MLSFFLSILLYVYPFILFHLCFGGDQKVPEMKSCAPCTVSDYTFATVPLPGITMKNGYLPCRLQGLYFLTVLTLVLGVIASYVE